MHTYASYFRAPLPRLETVAEYLVGWGVAECAATSDGDIWWNRDDAGAATGAADRRRRPPGRGHLRVELSHDRRAARMEVEALSAPLEGFPANAVFDWSWARYSELMLFGDGPLPPRYVWAALGACTFVRGERAADSGRQDPPGSARDAHALVVYPTLKIFETGVVFVHFRMFSPERPVPLAEYVRKYLGAPFTEFDRVAVPPGVAAWAPVAVPAPGTFRWYRRPLSTYRQWRYARRVASRVAWEPMGDFTFPQVSLGLVQEEALAEAVTTALQPEMEGVTRRAMQRAAAAQGVRLSETLEVLGVESLSPRPGAGAAARPTNDARLGEGASPEARSGAGPVGETPDQDRASDGGAPAVLPSEIEFDFDFERFERDVLRASTSSARRVVRELASEVRKAGLGTPETFSTLALTLMRIAGVVACARPAGPRGRLGMAVFGPAAGNDLGDHWTGRPHSHLFRFAHQSASAAENAARYGADFAAILARTPVRAPDMTGRWLPPSSRAFDDYGAYLTVSGTLWVHGRDSLEATRRAHAHENRAVLVHEQQAKVELIEYGYSLHRRIADRVFGRGGDRLDDADALLAAQRDLADFEWAVQDTGHFGEVRDQLEEGWTAFGVPRLRARVAEGLRARHEAAAYRRGVVAGRWASFVALLAGLLAVPPLVDIVLKPAWRMTGAPRPTSDDAFALLLSGVGLGLVGAVLSAGYVWARRARTS